MGQGDFEPLFIHSQKSVCMRLRAPCGAVRAAIVPLVITVYFSDFIKAIKPPISLWALICEVFYNKQNPPSHAISKQLTNGGIIKSV